MPKPSFPAAGEALPATGQLIPFHPALREFEALDIPWGYVPGEEEFNRRNLVAIRCAIAICNKDGAELLRRTKALAVDNAEALDELRVNWEWVLDYFDILMSIVAEARKRTETCAAVAGIKLREVA